MFPLQTPHPPLLIIIGGFAGTGKSTVSRRLSAELRIPRLGSDTLGRTIKDSAGIRSGNVNATWIAYDVLFRLCEEFLQTDVSVILDLTMGWPFQWQHVDRILQRQLHTHFLPILLRCPLDVCLERTGQRHAAHPDRYDPPEVYATDPKNRELWHFLATLERPEVHWVDADRPQDTVYQEVSRYLALQPIR